MRTVRRGYDRLKIYKLAELQKMYEAEGHPPNEAARLAYSLYSALNNLSSYERRLWEKVRAFETQLAEGE